MKEEPNQKVLELIDKLYRLRHRYQSTYFWPVRMTVNDFFVKNEKEIIKILKKEGKFSDVKKLRNILLDSFDKINAMFYHLERLKQEEAQLIEISSKIAKEAEKDTVHPGIFGGYLDSVSYEFESFIMQTKSCLDVFSRAVGYFYKAEVRFSGLENFVRSNQKANKLIDIFNKEDEYVLLKKEFISGQAKEAKRDFIAHRGFLAASSVNIPINNKAQKIKKNFLRKENIEMEEYCTIIFYKTCDFMVHILEIILEKELQTGKKTSR